MTNKTLGITVDLKMQFVFPRSDGKWVLREGTLSAVDGLHHKIAFPGFETRSGEGFGITATYHIVQNLRNAGPGVIGDILRMIVVNGILGATQPHLGNVELVIE